MLAANVRTGLSPAPRWPWLLLALAGCTAPDSPDGPVSYRPAGTGTEAQFEPLRMSLHYVLDNAQLGDADTSDFGDKLKLVWDHLREPKATIENSDGGRSDFVNTELFPIDLDNLDDSLAILPNVFLHGLGGGMLYRKTGEWFAAHDVPLPWLTAGVVATVTEGSGKPPRSRQPTTATRSPTCWCTGRSACGSSTTSRVRAGRATNSASSTGRTCWSTTPTTASWSTSG
ncbi:MAG: hypothetical protein WAT39_08870 [Planctomycetota bacterium]